MIDYFFCEECETYHQPNRIINGEMLSACEREIPHSYETSKSPSTISKHAISKPLANTNFLHRPSNIMNISTRQSPNKITFSYKNPQKNMLESASIYTNRERVSNYPFRNIEVNERESMNRSIERKDIKFSGHKYVGLRDPIVPVRNISPSPNKFNRFSSAFLSPYQLNRQPQPFEQPPRISRIEEIHNSSNISSFSSPIVSVNNIKSNQLIPELEPVRISHNSPITLSQIPKNEYQETNTNYNKHFNEQEFWLERANSNEKELIEEGEEENELCGTFF